MISTLQSLPDRHDTMPSIDGEGIRPAMHRLRSNSVPVAVKLMDCTIEEAGIIFSAAEKASARRRRHLSVDTSPPALSQSSSSDTLSSVAYEDSIEVDFVHIKSPTTAAPGISTPPNFDDQTPQASPGVKAYNQDMVRFIQERLQTISASSEPPDTPRPTARATFEPKEYDFSPPQRPERPTLTSHFSNWSSTSAGSYGPDELIVDLASSPPATGSILDNDGEIVEQGRAQVLQFRRRSQMERTSSPNYFSYPYHGSKPIRAPVLQTPLSSEIRRASYACSQSAASPLIDLDASQPEVSRASRGDFFFNLSAPLENHLIASPDSSTLGLNPGPLLSSPRPIRC